MSIMFKVVCILASDVFYQFPHPNNLMRNYGMRFLITYISSASSYSWKSELLEAE